MNDCTGCGACAGACPKSCITMMPDRYGVIRPEIDPQLCIDCKKCVAVCPSVSVSRRKESASAPFVQQCYAAYHLTEAVRNTSTSGGLSAALCSEMIQRGGVVYGASTAGPGIVEHIRVETSSELPRLQKSKYVQSQIPLAVYKQLLEDKRNHRDILFTGTPCQVAGVRSVLGNYPRLYTVDLICHGVPSRQILQDHIRTKVKDISSIHEFYTRFDGEYGLQLHTGGGGKILYSKHFPYDEYSYGFMYGLFFRPNCYTCKYAFVHRSSDITIGDFWGLGETTYPKEKVSVVLVNSSQGETLLDWTRHRLFLERREVDEAVQGNAQLREPSKKHAFYNVFHWLYPRIGYKGAITISMLRARMIYFILSLRQRMNKIIK